MESDPGVLRRRTETSSCRWRSMSAKAFRRGPRAEKRHSASPENDVCEWEPAVRGPVCIAVVSHYDEKRLPRHKERCARPPPLNHGAPFLPILPPRRSAQLKPDISKERHT